MEVPAARRAAERHDDVCHQVTAVGLLHSTALFALMHGQEGRIVVFGRMDHPFLAVSRMQPVLMCKPMEGVFKILIKLTEALIEKKCQWLAKRSVTTVEHASCASEECLCKAIKL